MQCKKCKSETDNEHMCDECIDELELFIDENIETEKDTFDETMLVFNQLFYKE